MSWEKEVEEIRRREALAEKMGGEEKLARQHARGKLDARERLKRLLDPDSFREIGKIAGRGRYDENGELVDFAASNFIFGRGRINGRAIVASADDFTVRGGAADAAIHRKFAMAEQMAHETGLPIVRMIDGTGGGGSVKSLEQMGFTYVPYVPGWEHIVKNLDTVPVVALALGPTAGLGAMTCCSGSLPGFANGSYRRGQAKLRAGGSLARFAGPHVRNVVAAVLLTPPRQP